MNEEKVLRLNAGAAYQNPNAMGVAPDDNKLRNAVSTIVARLDRTQEALVENAIRGAKPSLDTIVIPEGFPLEHMLWKFKNNAVKKIVDCEKLELLEIILDLTSKIAQMQSKIAPVESMFQPEIMTIPDMIKQEKEKAALSLIA